MKQLPILILCAFLTACSDSNQQVDSTAAQSSISWFDGSVTEAFASAKSLDRPLFLYWGAVWCPPCQEIKHTVFKSRRFISQTESFVPVYLDGDTEKAQALGEKFGVKGYPTMIVFNPEGREVTRIPGGIDISRYNDVLELSLNSITPTADLVKRVVSSPETITESHLKQLAFYSWGQDHTALPRDYSPELFLAMSELAGDEVSKARLFMQYLYEVASAHETSSGDPDADNEADPKLELVAGAGEKVNKILDSDDLILANWDSLAYYSTELLPHIAAGETRVTLEDKWQTRLKALSDHESLSVAERLAGILPSLELYFLDDEDRPLDPELIQWVLEATHSADSVTKNSFARQSVVNQINHVLQASHLMDEAKNLLLREIERSPSPYYFMSSLASIAEKQDENVVALDWRRKAYENSVGSATRFQWGANYVRAVIRLQPDNEILIQTTAIALLDELQSNSDVFAGRNFRVLMSLNQQLNSWQAERGPTLLAEFKTTIDRRCQEQEKGSVKATNCATLESQRSDISNPVR